MKLTANQPLLAILSIFLFLTSCQKEIDLQDPVNPGNGTGNNNNSIIGEYNFVGTIASTYSSVTVSDQGSELKAVSVSGYITQNNVGTVKITASDIIFMAVGYSIDTTVNLKTYLDGVLFDDSDLPYMLTVPPTNTTNPYTRINIDSLNITGALGVPDPSGATPTGPVGIKTSWSGDTLLLKIASSFTQNISQGGVPGTLTGSVNGIAKLKKR